MNNELSSKLVNIINKNYYPPNTLLVYMLRNHRL